MAHRRASIKKIRVDERRQERNVRVRSELKTYARKFVTGLKSGNAKTAAEAASSFIAKLDKAVKKGILHKNRVSRKKSRIQAKVNALAKKAA